jgi:hypothetical protein
MTSRSLSEQSEARANIDIGDTSTNGGTWILGKQWNCGEIECARIRV